MSNDELIQQHHLCEQWQDADQWDALGVIYFQQNYLMNANYCFRQADELRAVQIAPLMEVVQCQ
jgi:cytochrome c-type biogenesis protein CcmH/NrfG